MITTREYGQMAARKYITAYDTQGGSRRTVGCNLTFAQNMLSRYIHAARLEAIALPDLPPSGTPSAWLSFAHEILATTTCPQASAPAA